MFLSKNFSYESWNFGPEQTNEKTVKEIVSAFQSVNPKILIDFSKIENFHETKILKLNSNKAKKLLNWRPLLSFDEMVRLTNEWYENINDSKIEMISKNQLDYFTSKI